LLVRTEGKISVSFSLNNLLGVFSSVTLLVFLGGTSFLEGVGLGIVSACPNVSNDFKADVFELHPLIVITSEPIPKYQVLAFAGTRGSTKFEYSFDFPPHFCYFTSLFHVTI